MAIVLLIVVIAVTVGISIYRDEKSKNNLVKKLKSMGYCIDIKFDVPNIYADNMPFCFMVDRTNKKWFLSNYRANHAEAYDFKDIIDYKIVYRFKGDAITKGKELSGSFSEFADSNSKILDIVELKKENCEYISFELVYQGKALETKVCNKFVLFESQEGKFASARNHDFVASSACIEVAKQFEDVLIAIIVQNKGK